MLGLFDRKPDLIVHTEEPLNAETPLDRLRASYVTAQRDFYVRTHGTVPKIDADAYRLAIGGDVRTASELSLEDLRTRFETRTVMAAMQCAGNRRADLNEVAPVSGDPWAPGAIGNARWTGIGLADILRAAGTDETADLHVAFEAHDEIEIDGERFRYGISIALAKALSAEVLLAWEINGEPLSPEHGFPLRLVVPGFAGVRSPKWLSSVTVQATPSDNHMQQRDYKLFPPDVSKETADWQTGLTIDAMPITAAICEPAAFAALPAGRTSVRGYAMASTRAIARVDVSADGGRTWMQADLEHDRAAPWSWTLWSAEVELPAGAHELAVRAWDEAGQTQPAEPENTWNFKGYLSTAWHRVQVRAG